jgi:hypothetical protein
VSIIGTRETAEIRISNDAGVDPAVVGPLESEASRVMDTFVSALPAGRCPVVRVFLECLINFGRLVIIDTEPYQIDVRLQSGLMPPDVADEYAAHSTAFLQSVL